MAEAPVVRIASRYIPGMLGSVRSKMPYLNVEEIPVHAAPGKTPSLDSSQIEKIKEANILLVDTDIVKDLMYDLPNLKWMQSTSAGIEVFLKHVDQSKGRLPFVVTRFGGYFGAIMGEYVMGSIIARERHFFEINEDCKNRKWDKKWGKYRCLADLCLGILGVGAIGSDIARYAKNMGMSVWGVGRKKEREPSPYIDHYRSTEGLSEVLAACDYICSVLPSTPETRGLLSGDVLQHCSKKKSVLINVGRGDVIDEESLVKAVNKGWLGGAILDCSPGEPLQPESPLWDLPGVFITPHVSGMSFDSQVVEAFSKNYQRFMEGKQMEYVVDINQGY